MAGMKNLQGDLKKALSYRWVVWGVMVLAYMVVFFHRLAAGVVREDLVRDFGLSASSFGSLASMYFYAYMIMQIPVGMLADSLGARVTVFGGTLLAAAGSVLFGMASSVPMLFAGRFLVGIGVSTVFVSILKILSQWYRNREFASMSGLTAFIGNFGGVLAQLPLAFLVARFTWRTTFIGIGGVSLLLAVLCYLFIRNTPQDMGFPPVNEALQSKVPGPPPRLSKAFGEVLTCRNIWFASLLCALSSATFLSLSGAWGISYLREVFGFDAREASKAVSWCVFGGMAGTFSVGCLSDRLGRRKLPMIILCLVSVATWAPLVFGGAAMLPRWTLSPLLFVLGFSASSFILGWAITKEVSAPAYTGIAIAVVNTVTFLATALLTTGMGSIMDRYAHLSVEAQYQKAFLLCLICALLALAGGALLPETWCRNVERKEPLQESAK